MQSNLLEIVQERLDEEVTKLYKGKKGSCSVDGCPNDICAGGLCNAHYLRSKRGAEMGKPVQNKGSSSCIECNGQINNKGGWNRCANHYKMARQKAIKKALVGALGGECSSCGGEFPLEVYDFHHVGEKDLNPSYMIANRSLEAVVEEISKCVLLCANCHRIEHAK
jgi:hypothetical protein